MENFDYFLKIILTTYFNAQIIIIIIIIITVVVEPFLVNSLMCCSIIVIDFWPVFINHDQSWPCVTSEIIWDAWQITDDHGCWSVGSDAVGLLHRGNEQLHEMFLLRIFPPSFCISPSPPCSSVRASVSLLVTVKVHSVRHVPTTPGSSEVIRSFILLGEIVWKRVWG